MALRSITLLNVRLAFAKGLTEKSFPAGGKAEKAKYNAKFIITKDHPQYKLLVDTIVSLAQEAWPKNYNAVLKELKSDKRAFCFRDGDTTTWDGFEGNMFLALTNNHDLFTNQGINFLPSHSNKAKDYITDVNEIRRMFYSGCYVNIIATLYSPKDGGNSIHGVLKIVHFCKNGESLEGGSVDTSELPEDVFAPVTDFGELCEDMPSTIDKTFEGF